MGKLISVTAYVLDSTPFASASLMAINADHFSRPAQNASTAQKQSNPAASGSINTIIYANWPSNNEGENHVILVSDSVATIVAGS